jgi:cell division protein FtsL
MFYKKLMFFIFIMIIVFSIIIVYKEGQNKQILINKTENQQINNKIKDDIIETKTYQNKILSKSNNVDDNNHRSVWLQLIYEKRNQAYLY